ncbi:MAG: amino acid adenylation domain-containing protein [Bryobacterales bacterium]
MTELQEKLRRLSPDKRRLLALRLSSQANGAHKGTEPAQASIPIEPEKRGDPFPLTDLQQAYWIGRGEAFGIDVASHCYLELEGTGVDLNRLNDAWRRVIERHEMLRAAVLPHGEQQILDSLPPYEIQVTDLRGEGAATVSAKLTALRDALSHQILNPEQWPLFEIQACQLDEDKVRLFVSLDALFIDGWSIYLLLNEWSRFYNEPEWSPEPITLSFRDWVLAENEAAKSADFQAAKQYWQERIPNMPPAPMLPLASQPALKNARFVRHERQLDAEHWQKVKARAAKIGMTPTGVLVSAYAEVLSLWSGSRRFTINLPSFNRPPLHPESNKLVAEIASFTLLEIDNSGDDSFEARAKRHQEQLWQDLSHSAFGGVKVLREMAQARSGYTEALMPVIFTSLPENTRVSELPGLGKVVFRINQTSQVWLDNHVTEQDGALIIDWDSVDRLLPEGMSEDMLDAYMRLLKRLADEEECWQDSWTVLTQKLLPRKQVERRNKINSVKAPLPERLLQDLFAEQVLERPHQKAVVAKDRTLTYAELHDLSLRWGRKLRARGVGPNQLVAVVMEKGWEQIAAVLAILEAGGAYLPIDASLPKERLWYVLQDSGAKIALTQSWLEDRLEWPENLKRFAVDRESVAEFDSYPLEPAQTPDDLAYVLYTSGSTGRPKGVMVEQRGVVNCILRTNTQFGIGPGDRALCVSALHHDMSVHDVFGMLAAGGTLVMPGESDRRDPVQWLELIRREGVTVWTSVPAMMEMLLEYAGSLSGEIPESMRLAFLGGDWISLTLPQRLSSTFPKAQLVSVGGPTETTLWNIWYPVGKVDTSWKSIPYGKPTANNCYYILNEAGGDCPDWTPGEQYAGGVQVSRGYWADAEKTAERFVTHPRTGERLFRTGDRGRYLPDGNIEFLGRVDFQVKIHGQRIELGEIEAALQEHSGVKAAVVAAWGEGQAKQRLAGYVVPRGEPVTAEELTEFLRTKLPDYMAPSAYVFLDQLPLSANGKVDRRQLPQPETPAPAAQPTDDTRDESGTARTIAQTVGEVLGIAAPDFNANLVGLGASSIDMVRLGNALEKRFGMRPRMDQIFRMQTVAKLAEYYDQQLGQQTMGASAASTLNSGDPVSELISSYKVMINPEERERFKESKPGIRKNDQAKSSVALSQAEPNEALLDDYRKRRSYRRFSLRPVPFESISRLLGYLRPVKLDGKAKYLYASPGGLYPTQVYLHCKTGRVEGLDSGTYYYHPVDHRLVLLEAKAEINRDIHIPFINTPIYDEAAFSLFFVCEFAALAPGYGERSLHFATMEAGIMTHLLESRAYAHGIGLCSIGSIDFEQIRPMFDLSPSQVLIHSIVGGRMEDAADVGALQSDRVASLQERIKKMSPDEVKSMLAAHKGRAGEGNRA